MVVQRGDLECCVRRSGPWAAGRLARRAVLRAALHSPPGRPVPGRPGGTAQDGTAQDGTPPLPVMTGTVLDASPQILILYDADGEHRLVLPPATEVWRGRRAEPTALEPGDSVLVRLLPGQRNVADRIWANAGRVTGVIVRREADGVLVAEGRTGPDQAVLIPGWAAGRLQVRFPRLDPGYLIDVIGLRRPGYLEALLPATSQPAHRQATRRPRPRPASTWPRDPSAGQRPGMSRPARMMRPASGILPSTRESPAASSRWPGRRARRCRTCRSAACWASATSAPGWRRCCRYPAARRPPGCCTTGA